MVTFTPLVKEMFTSFSNPLTETTDVSLSVDWGGSIDSGTNEEDVSVHALDLLTLGVVIEDVFIQLRRPR